MPRMPCRRRRRYRPSSIPDKQFYTNPLPILYPAFESAIRSSPIGERVHTTPGLWFLLVIFANPFPALVLQRHRARAFQRTFHALTVAYPNCSGALHIPPNQIARRQAHDQNNSDCIQNPSFPSAAFTCLIISLISTKVSSRFQKSLTNTFWQQKKLIITDQ